MYGFKHKNNTIDFRKSGWEFICIEILDLEWTSEKNFLIVLLYFGVHFKAALSGWTRSLSDEMEPEDRI